MSPPDASADLARATIVVPCYNEASRLDGAALRSLVEGEGAPQLLFVNDGSSDGTEAVLRALAAGSAGRMEVLSLERNSGKGEAVRAGLRQALTGPAAIVGYLDADLATPVEEARRLLEVFRASEAAVLIASRVALLGRQVKRSAARHYLGRLFASAASVVLRVPVYDTQCGAKLFRRSPALAAALEAPFVSRWAFDVELLGRLLAGSAAAPPVPVSGFIEEPLRVWHAVPGSKLRLWHMAGAAADVVRIKRALARRRQP
jgi:glycosyltransferase involved in cell wall biosynthesis